MIPAYREYEPPAGVESVAACLWEQGLAADHAHLVVPDGCVDLIWLGEGQLVIAGADTGPRRVHLPAGARLSGIRLRPGAAGSVLGLPASHLRDQEVDAQLVWGKRAVELEHALALASPEGRLALLCVAVSQRGAQPDPLVRAAAALLAVARSRVASVAAELGVSERHLHRRVLHSVGYGPKMLARVARLRRLVRLPDASLASRALQAGYASQAHMNDEVRRLTGTTPVRFLEDAASTAA